MGREVERLKLIHMPDFDDLIYDSAPWPNASTPV